MIKLSIKPYCQDCPRFEVKQDTNVLMAVGDIEPAGVNTILTCENAAKCTRIERYLKATMPEPFKHKRCICDECIYDGDKNQTACVLCGDGGVSNFEPKEKNNERADLLRCIME